MFATIKLENKRQIVAKLHRVSLTGGLLDLAVYLEERLSVHAAGELLFPVRGVTGYLQPFRLTSIREEQLHILDREITELLKRTSSSIRRHRLGLSSPPSFLLELL